MRSEDPTTWQNEPVTLVPHNAEWASRFEEEAMQIQAVIGPWIAGGVHHVGSTAEYGLLKRNLAAEHADDRDEYTRAKAGFVKAVTALAHDWRGSSSG
jgi:GrpB-like predicted nucleotidyltransferase (UPF0157 family)